MRSFPTRVLGFVALSMLVVSCGDSEPTTQPTNVSGPTAERLLLLGTPKTVKVVTRNTPLAKPISASATIGILGGRIAISGAGVSVLVPPLAVGKATKITVTAVAGNQVAYEFQPHGIKFLVPLVVTQTLKGTSAANNTLLASNLLAGYFSDLSALNPKAGTGLVTELLGTTLSLATGTITFPVFHFSGYLIATGEDADISSLLFSGNQH